MPSISRPTTRAAKATSVEKQLVELIKNGVYLPGQALPPMRELAKQFHVHYNTTQTIIGRLEQEGWVTAVDRKGVFVARVLPDADTIARRVTRDDPIWIRRLGIICASDEVLRQSLNDPQIIASIESSAAESDVRVGRYPTGAGKEADAYSAVVPKMKADGIEGVIVVGPRDLAPLERLLGELLEWGIPTIVCPIGRLSVPPKYLVPAVDHDNVMVGNIATEHLVKLGHRELAMATYDIPRNYIDERIAGYRHVCEVNGLKKSVGRVIKLPVKAMTYAEQVRVGREAFAKLPAEVTGIFCMNDRVAGGVIEAAEAAGREIGLDLSVIGHDNDEQWWHKEISTVIPPTLQLGRRAWERLNELQGRARSKVFENIIVPSRVLWRRSTGPRIPG